MLTHGHDALRSLRKGLLNAAIFNREGPVVAAKAAGAMESSEARNNPFLSNIERNPKLLCYNIIHIL